VLLIGEREGAERHDGGVSEEGARPRLPQAALED
jgi:hypothetical protein